MRVPIQPRAWTSVSYYCCQVEVSVSCWLFVERSPIEYGVSLSVILKPRWGPGLLGLSHHKKDPHCLAGGINCPTAFTSTYFHLYEGSQSLTDGVTHQTNCKCTYFHLYEGSDSLTDGVTHQTACKCTYFHLYEGSDSLRDGVTQHTVYTYTYFHISGKSASPEADTRL